MMRYVARGARASAAACPAAVSIEDRGPQRGRTPSSPIDRRNGFGKSESMGFDFVELVVATIVGASYFAKKSKIKNKR